MAKPSNYDELYPGRFLKAGLFKGTKPTLTIKDVDIEQLEDSTGKPKTKAILAFEERPMELVMCKTNGLCIKAMFGKELKDWIGKRVTFFASTWNGEECIRVWGSPDIKTDMNLSIELPRRKPFPMTMHAIKAKAAAKPGEVGTAPAHNPLIASGWEALGWTPEEGQHDLAGFTGDSAAYLQRLGVLIDEANAVEA